jgi:predicted RNA-binding Zn ribbon-like protein
VTSQLELDSYRDAGVLTSVALVNGLAAAFVRGKAAGPADALGVIRRAVAVDAPSVAALRERDVPGFVALAKRLREVIAALDAGDLEMAAERLNAILAKHPATPYLGKEDGVWRLHHHPAEAALLPMWTSSCAEGLARMIGDGYANRIGVCDAAQCDQVFIDTSKNASRRFCSLTCQNRTKTATFRSRQAGRA